MKTSKILVFITFVFLLSFSSLFAATAQVVNPAKVYPVFNKTSVVRVSKDFLNQNVLSPTKKYIKQLSYSNVPLSTYESSKWGNIRGHFLEDVTNDVYSKTMANGYRKIDATYNNGINGLDGLYLKIDSKDKIRNALVIEVKSGNAKLKMDGKVAPQLTKEWTIADMDKSINAKREALKNITDSAKKKNIEKEIYFLEVAKNNVADDVITKRLLVNTDVKNGRFSIKQSKILEELDWKSYDKSRRTMSNTFVTSEADDIVNFSILKKDVKNLTEFEKQVRSNFLDAFEKNLEKNGFNQKEIKKIVHKLETNKRFDIKRLDADSNSFRMKNLAVKSGMALISVASEVQTLYDYSKGNISTADMVLFTADNAAGIGAAFSVKLNGVSNIIFCVVQGVRNVLKYNDGKLDGFTTVLNAATGIGGFVAGSALAAVAAKVVGGLAILPTGPLGKVITIGASLITFGAVNFFVSQFLRNFIEERYELLKKPEQFQITCDYVRNNCIQMRI